MSEAGRGRAASPSRGHAYDILKTLKWFGAKLKSCAQIARRLQAFTPYQAGDAEFLRALPESLARVTGDSAGGWRNEKLPNHLRAALTSEAAIYAPDDKQPARFWNLATGIPQRVYMAVESPTEGKRVVVGVTFSAHEFYTWEHQRLNDDQWRALVYAPSPAPALTQTQVKPLSGSR